MQLLLWLCLCLLLLICQSSPSQASEYICTRARNSTSSHPIPPRYSEHPTGGARGMRPPERRMALQAELLLLAPRRQARKGMWQQQVALQLLRRRDTASAPAAASLPSSPLANLVDYGKLKLNLNSLPKRIMLRRRDDNELLNPKVGLLCCGN